MPDQTAAIIVAAGRGLRAGGGVPKQYRDLDGRSVLEATLSVFDAHPGVDRIVVVINPDDSDKAFEIISKLRTPHIIASGGATRTASVRAGLTALSETAPDRVLIHDAARPFLSPDLIDELLAALEEAPGALPGLPLVDALMRVDQDGRLSEAVDRETIRAAQTPQAFDYQSIMAAYDALGEDVLPDDAAVLRRAGGAIKVIEGEAANIKLTRPEDFSRFAKPAAPALSVTGMGFDVHRLAPGHFMSLCGVRIEDGLSLVGHSDADVGLHALTDAILGAAGQGDIGQHFPPSDPQWKGAESDRFVAHAIELLREAGGQLVHIDLTLIAERPKIGPHRDAMRQRVAQLCGLPLARVNIKATTTEGLGFTGRGEGIAAQAVVNAVIHSGAGENS